MRREEWVPVIDFDAWRILKVLPKNTFNEVYKEIGGDRNRVLDVFNALRIWGIIDYNGKGQYELSELGKELLNLLEEVQKIIRESKPSSSYVWRRRGKKPKYIENIG